MLQLDDEVLLEYPAESRELLCTAETDLLALEADGSASGQDRINRVFRGIHTIKGGAGFFELRKIGELAHHAENLLDLIRSEQLSPTSDRITVLLRTTDQLSGMIQHPATSNMADIDDLVGEIITLCSDENAEGHEEAPSGKSGPPDPGSGALRILLAEDDFTNRLLMQSFLSRYGECHIAVNGREAVEAAHLALDEGRRYDLICMDILMPEMTGRQAVREVRRLEERKGIPSSEGTKIFMTTSVKDIGEVFRCFAELCDSYLLKPIDLGQLLTLMKSFHLVN